MRLLLIFSILFFPLMCIAQTKENLYLNQIQKHIDSLPNNSYVSLALINGYHVEYIGIHKLKDTLEMVDLKDSLFEIGSLTKVFTSTILASEVVENGLKLNRKINRDLPFKVKNKTKLNYLSLANHTSGLDRLPANLMMTKNFDANDPYSTYDETVFIDFLTNQLKIESSKKGEYNYSNLGAGLLAYSLVQRTGKSFETLLEERIFNQYGLKNTGFHLIPTIDGILADGTKATNWKFNAMKGAGGLVSNVHDLQLFILAQFNETNQELSLTRKRTATINDNLAIGLGWHIFQAGKLKGTCWHNGATGGYTSSLAFHPKLQTGVIVLSNISGLSKTSQKVDQICFSMMSYLNENSVTLVYSE